MYGIYIMSSITAILLMLMQVASIVRELKDTVKKEKSVREIFYIFHLMKEDIIKSIYISPEKDTIAIYGITLSVSESKNDENWGIVLRCSDEDRKALIYNLKPSSFIWVWNGDKKNVKFRAKRVISWSQKSKNNYEVEIENCQDLLTGYITANYIYEVRWMSEKGRIYRYMAKYEVGKKEEGKFFAGKGNIISEGGKITIKNGAYQISFSISTISTQ